MDVYFTDAFSQVQLQYVLLPQLQVVLGQQALLTLCDAAKGPQPIVGKKKCIVERKKCYSWKKCHCTWAAKTAAWQFECPGWAPCTFGSNSTAELT